MILNKQDNSHDNKSLLSTEAKVSVERFLCHNVNIYI